MGLEAKQEFVVVRKSATTQLNNEAATVINQTAEWSVTLKTGLNMISLPLQPDQPVTSETLARDLTATVILRLDADTQRFMSFVAEHYEVTNFEIGGGWVSLLMSERTRNILLRAPLGTRYLLLLASIPIPSGHSLCCLKGKR